MADSIRAGAHGCVINPKDKDAGPQIGFTMEDLLLFAVEPPA